jgi:hypothetical protein
MKKAELVGATFATLFVATTLIAVTYNIIVHGVR